MHTDHAGGLSHVAACRAWVHPLEWTSARGFGAKIQDRLAKSATLEVAHAEPVGV
jgi:hypothetical protein